MFSIRLAIESTDTVVRLQRFLVGSSAVLLRLSLAAWARGLRTTQVAFGGNSCRSHVVGPSRVGIGSAEWGQGSGLVCYSRQTLVPGGRPALFCDIIQGGFPVPATLPFVKAGSVK